MSTRYNTETNGSSGSKAAASDDAYACTAPIDFSKKVDWSSAKGQTAIVTGGASGIGLGISTALLEAGAAVVLADVSPKGEAVAEGLRAKGGKALFVVCDVTSWAQQKAMFKAAAAWSPSKRIDLVIPSAGVSGPDNDLLVGLLTSKDRPSLDSEPAEPLTRTLDINLTGVYYTVNLAVWYFRATAGASPQQGRHILMISSLAGYIALPPAMGYNGAKFGVRGIFKNLRAFPQSVWDVPGGVRVNMLAPTWIQTDMVGEAEQPLRDHDMKVGSVEDVVQGMMRVICDESINGRAICIAEGKPAGSANFDLCDDYDGHDAGREFLGHLKDGTLGPGFVSLRNFSLGGTGEA